MSIDARGYGGGNQVSFKSLFAGREVMQFIVGVLSTLCLVSFVVVVWMVLTLNNKIKNLDKNMRVVIRLITKMPNAQNVIHLGLKESRVSTELPTTTLSIKPEDFQVKADKLYAKLINGLKVKDHPDTGVRAYCILNHAGIEEMLDGGSRREAQAALTRLLANEDDEAAGRFLKTLADSIADTQLKAEPEVPVTTH